MPTLRAFRALRYDSSASSDLSSIICPPYDVISSAERAALIARDQRNAVRLELPAAPEGTTEPDAPYREAARQLVAWRSDGTLRKDPTPSIYVYESRYRVPGTDREAVSRGFFSRLKLTPFSPGGEVRPHERTMSGPKEDRFRLLKATGVNLSSVIGLYDSGGAETSGLLDRLTARPPDVDATDDDGVRHRCWVCPTEGEGSDPAAQALLGLAAEAPVTIADGHHRYETALRYREERGHRRACESDPAYDYVLMLLYDISGTELVVLPTHRVVIGGASGEALLEALSSLFEVERVDDRDALLEIMTRPSDVPADATGTGRIGVWTAGRGAILRPRPEAYESQSSADGSAALRGLDVSVLARALQQIHGIDAPALAAGGKLRYVKDAAEAVELVDGGTGDAAFILDATPVRAVLEVAAAGEVMPQKSTYFYPKAATGLLFNPLEG